MYAVLTIMGALCNNATIIIPNFIYDPEKTLHAIRKENCTIIFAMPKLFIELISKQKKLKLDIKNLIGITAGTQCTQEPLTQIKKELGLKKLKVNIGITEYAISFASHPKDKDEKNIDTVGCLLNHLEAKVIDNKGKIVPFGTPGELCIRGYSTMMGYWGDEQQTRKILGSDGWLKTGDYFILEPNRYGKIIGRISDIITKGTEKIFPKEIESLLGTFPAIEEVYVVGVPDKHWGEELCAFIRLREGHDSLSSEEIYEFCKGKIQSIKIPRYVRLVEDYPKTLSGKKTKSVLESGENSELSYFHSVGKNPLVYRTIGQQLKLSAQSNAEREAFVFLEENKRFTYEQLLSEADRLAAGFQCLGLNKGDRVGILMPNVSAWPITMFAAARAGLISVSLNPTYTPQEIQDCLNKVSAKALVASEKFGSKIYYEQLLEILPELSSCSSRRFKAKDYLFFQPLSLIQGKTIRKGTLPLSDVMSLPTIQQINSIEDQQDDISPESGCIILFTSGFTGSPKAVLLSHNCVINNALPTKIVEVSKSRVCMPLAFCHFYALVTTMGAFCNDATVIVPNYIFDSEKTFNAIDKEKCTIIFGVPNLFMGLMYTQKKLKFDFSNLIGITAGANCSPEAFYKIKKELGLKKLKIAMGMTESGISFASLPDDKEENIIDTVGYLYSHLEAKVIDNYGKLVPFGTPGELCIRGPLTMKGYWGDEEQTRKILGSDGWLKTGDYFILEPNGYGKIIGRISDIITKGSEKIFPKEIESLLGTFPAIEEVYVVGVPDEHWGEELCAFIRLREGHHSLSSEDIYEFCKGKIPSLKIPRYVRLVDDFPKTVSGKIKTIELKKKFKC
uniref:Medium-chain acyl-CoA ligase ACSF2, mitochondrial n=1 Tax=Lutzomyia longipalpis TaxID=7200 RepID=A0A7G3A7Q9_LUTLO